MLRRTVQLLLWEGKGRNSFEICKGGAELLWFSCGDVGG